MPDLVAIVSKAVFEKDAKGFDLGDVWPVRAYTSSNKALDALTSGGTLFLVTVRPDHVLWLVAILENPTHAGGAWRASANQIAITDLTSTIGTITFANGGKLVRDAKLGMSLQTPRALTPETAALLRAAAHLAGPTSGGMSDKPAVTTSVEQAVAASTTKPTKPPKATKPAKPAKLAIAATPPMSGVARPDGVPPDAQWNPFDESWEAGAIDDRGARQGPWRSWRADGTLRGQVPYVDHDAEGINRRFHPDGSLASEGHYRNGVLLDVTFFRSKVDTDEPTLIQGGDEVTRAELVADAEGLRDVTVRFLDVDGRQRDHRGVLAPPRPAGVSPTARWFSDVAVGAPDGSIGGWVDGATLRGSGKPCGTWRWWTTPGTLVREARYTPWGVLQTVRIIDGVDSIGALLERYVADPHKVRYELARAWSPALHDEVRARLAHAPAVVAREYVDLLHCQLEYVGPIWRYRVPEQRRIVEVVDEWEARTDNDQVDVDTWYLLGAGARAAFALRDRPRVERWWRRFAAMPTFPVPENTYVFNSFGELAEGGAVRDGIVAMLDGSEPRACATIRAQLSSDSTFETVSADAIARLVTIERGCRPCKVMLRAAATREVWLLDEDGATHYWNGSELAPTTVSFEERGTGYRHLTQYDGADERVLLWPGKHGWLALQRYGRVVLWHEASYYSSRGQAEVTCLYWLKASSPVEAQRVMRLVAAAREKAGKPIDPWSTPKLGTIIRHYNKDGLNQVGVDGTRLTLGKRTIEDFPGHADAVVAFEKIEIERFRNGSMLERLSAQALQR